MGQDVTESVSDLISKAMQWAWTTEAITKEQQREKPKLDRITKFQHSRTNTKHSLQGLSLDFWRRN